jgi:class 3 adenylate cyclase
VSVTETLTQDGRLEAIIRGLESTGWAAEVCDADWKLVWVSSQARALIDGGGDGDRLGVGKHVLESRMEPAWQRMVSRETQVEWISRNVPQMLAEDPGAAERLAQMVDPELREAIEHTEPADIPIWTWITRTTGVVPAVNQVRTFGVRVRLASGEPLATVYMYGANLPATLLALVSQGDRGMFERMARLADPGRREAALLFADIQSSGELSRHLSSAAYFQLVQQLFTDLDGVVIDANGIVGKHAGDGLSAFFLTDDCDTATGAAGVALDTARKLASRARATAAGSEFEPAHDLQLNVGVHWGGALYMGQIVTGGRLEVTALGDEVNECARIQETARDGTVLASKALIERLDPEHAQHVGIDPDTVSYRTVAEMPGAPEKAVRDAGAIPVTAVPGE